MLRYALASFLFLTPGAAKAQEYDCATVKKMVAKVGGIANAKRKAEEMGFSKEKIQYYVNLCYKGKQ